MFCDTDSMAIIANKDGSLIPCPGGTYTMPDGRPAIQALSYEQTENIRQTLNRLNPYDPELVRDILKLEASCHGLAISAKHYALFGYDPFGRAVVPDKTLEGKDAFSRAGFGVYLNPIDPETKSNEWIRQVWQYFVDKAHGLNPPDLPWFNRPAMTRVTISSPHVARCLETFNEGKGYADQVKPFNFVLMTTDGTADPSMNGPSRGRYIAPYTRDPAAWQSSAWTWSNLYDRNADPIPGNEFPFSVMRRVVENYQKHPKSKSLGPDGRPCHEQAVGLLRRRTVRLLRLIHTGKEGNRLEETAMRLYNGLDGVALMFERPETGYEVGFINRYTQRAFAELVNAESATIRTGSERIYGWPVHIDHKVIDRYVKGENVGERNRQAILRTVAKLVAPTVGIDLEKNPRTRSRRDITPEVTIAMWHDAGEPSIGIAVQCLCGCGKDAAPQSRYARETCRKRYHKRRRTQE